MTHVLVATNTCWIARLHSSFSYSSTSTVRHEWQAEQHERLFLGDRYPDTAAPAIDLSKFKR